MASTSSALASPASATCAFALGAGFIHHESAAEKILAVQSGDGFFRFGIILDFREAETAGLACESIAKKRQRIGLNADFSEQCMNLFFRGLKREITHVQFLHGRSPCAPTCEETLHARLKNRDCRRQSVRAPAANG
jgi:hypothetical protein